MKDTLSTISQSINELINQSTNFCVASKSKAHVKVEFILDHMQLWLDIFLMPPVTCRLSVNQTQLHEPQPFLQHPYIATITFHQACYYLHSCKVSPSLNQHRIKTA